MIQTKRTLGTIATLIVTLLSIPLIASAVPHNPSTCSQFRNSSNSCFMDYDGSIRGYCEVCREGASCFMGLEGTEQAACEAYREDESCFMAFDGSDRGWCKVLKESASCDQALEGIDRDNCERGFFPLRHREWIFFWRN